jgi:predicted AlkP superfamily pyrophosphatase or phosphodiesterase
MRFITIFILSCFLYPVLSWGTPRLLVVVVVDQLRADYLTDMQKEFSGGFKTLMDKGAWFSNAHFRIVPTYTAVGHATLVTGEPPRQHGIVGNRWWDRKNKKIRQAAENESGELGADNLLSPTIGDLLKEKNPNSQVVSISLKDRAAVFMGGKKADGVFWFDKNIMKFIYLPSLGAPPSWFDPFNQRLGSLGVPKGWLGRKLNNKFLESTQADRVLLGLAKEVLSQYQLGKDEDPDILFVSFSVTDYLGHHYGPHSLPMKHHLKELDEILRELMQDLDHFVGKDHYATVLTSDHGVMPMPENTEGKKINGVRIIKKDFVEKIEEALQSHWPAKKNKWVRYCHPPNIYFNRSLANKKGVKWDTLLTEAATVIAAFDFVDEVYVPPNFGDGDYAHIYQRSYFPERSGDLLIRTRYGAFITTKKYGTSHGSPYDYDTHVPLLFKGRGIKAGRYKEAIEMRSMAPTCLQILEIDRDEENQSEVLPVFLD